jgi:hypothetical protein
MAGNRFVRIVRALPRLFMPAAALVLAACAAQPKRDEVMVEDLFAMLAGSYDNQAQARQSSEHSALRVMIAPVEAPLVGDHVFYVQEMAADDPRRVLSQRVYVINGVPDREQAILTQLDVKEPTRWRDGHLNRDLFRGLLTQDLRARAGCDLLWERSGRGFKATTGSGCRAASRATGETLHVEQRLELDAEGLDVSEIQRDAAGVLVAGVEQDPYYRYARRADAPW